MGIPEIIADLYTGCSSRCWLELQLQSQKVEDLATELDQGSQAKPLYAVRRP